MFSIIKNMFSGETIANGIDKAILTKEETLDNWNTLLQLYHPFKLAQRLIALVLIVPYALAWFITFVSSFLAESVDAQLKLLSGDYGTAVGVIIFFYFGGGAARSIFSKGKT